MYYKLQIKST